MAIPLQPLVLCAQSYGFVSPSSDEPFFIFQTDFGLQLRILDGIDGRSEITIRDSRTPSPQENESLEDAKEFGPYHYRIIPDGTGSSFLWYDPVWLPDPPDEFEVFEETIRKRYPTLAPFYFSWVRVFEESFEARECALGGDHGVFPDDVTTVAWEVAGFLIACWLVLQNDVECLEYIGVSFQNRYKIDKRNIEEKLREFLGDMNNLLHPVNGELV
jgi:hypothetical protein